MATAMPKEMLRNNNTFLKNYYFNYYFNYGGKVYDSGAYCEAKNLASLSLAAWVWSCFEFNVLI